MTPCCLGVLRVLATVRRIFYEWMEIDQSEMNRFLNYQARNLVDDKPRTLEYMTPKGPKKVVRLLIELESEICKVCEKP